MFVIPMLNLPTSSSFRWVLLDQYARRGKYSPMVQGCVAMTGLSLIRLDPPDAIAFSSTQVCSGTAGEVLPERVMRSS